MNVVALQDGNHRIINRAGQWMIEHRLGPGLRWYTDAFCVTEFGVGFVLSWQASRKLGYLPLHHWPIPPRLPKSHPGGNSVLSF